MASFAAVSCNEEYTDWANPQSNPQGPDFETITAAANLTANAIDFATVEESNVTLLTQSYVNGVNNAKLVYSNLKMNGIDVPCTSENGNLIVALSDIKNACETFYKSKAKTTRLMECTVKAASLDDEGVAVPAALTIDAATVDSFAFSFVTPELPAIANEDAYYYVGGYNGWNLAAPTPMEKNEDGTFSVILTVGNSEWFCFAPQSAVDNQDWNGLLRANSNGDTATSGFFNEDSNSGNSFQCEQGGTYKFTISPKDWTYSYVPYSVYFFVTGNPNGWTTDRISAFYPVDGLVQEYTTNWNGAWDLKAWRSDDVGNWDKAIGTEVDGDGSAAGKLITAGAQAFQSPEAGFYTLTVNFDELTYTWTKLENQTPTEYTNISLAGDFNGWGDTELARQNEGNLHNWYIRGLEVSAGGIKFKANLDWGTNWGADVNIDQKSYGVGTQDGPNISISAGTYDVYFNDITGRFVFIKQ